jgi:hypothetical protein
LFLFQGCYFGDNPNSATHIENDFWLEWWEYKTNQRILISSEKNTFNGHLATEVIEETVFAVGSSEDFIVVKQHPNKKQEIIDRLTQRYYVDKEGKSKKLVDKIHKSHEYYYKLPNPSDSIWLDDKDSIFRIDSVWCHRDWVWEHKLPDSLKPYKSITNYFIIDISNYDRDKRNGHKLYKFNNKEDFDIECKRLNITKDLTFKLIDKDLE